MKKAFEILSVNSQAFEKRTRVIIDDYKGNPSPFRLLVQSLRESPYNCETAVFETDYVDADYQDEFSAFYSTTFKSYPRRCTRIHFFAVKIPPAWKKPTLIDFGPYAEAYLGFAVVRPTDLQRMGRTVVRPFIKDSHREFIHCLAKFEAHLIGEKLFVRGMPFIQQDTQVGACAQASLWMVARYMSARFGYREFLPSEINQFAKSRYPMGRSLPAVNGLYWHQMLAALDAMDLFALSYALHEVDGCSPDVDAVYPLPDNVTDSTSERKLREATIKERRKAKLASITYRYIESGFPVIFGLRDHALVCIGHTYDSSAKAKLAIQRIPEFLVHDDARGPYLRMSILKDDQSGRCFSDVTSIIAIVPKEVMLTGEDAETLAQSLAHQLMKFPFEDKTFREFLKRVNSGMEKCLDSLEYRTYLCRSVDFQMQVREAIRAKDFDTKIGRHLLELDYPKYIWVAEISASHYLNSRDRNNRKCIGRIVIDSTAPAKTNAHIAIHFCDLFIARDRQKSMNAEPLVDFSPGSTPFKHRVTI